MLVRYSHTSRHHGWTDTFDWELRLSVCSQLLLAVVVALGVVVGIAGFNHLVHLLDTANMLIWDYWGQATGVIMQAVPSGWTSWARPTGTMMNPWGNHPSVILPSPADYLSTQGWYKEIWERVKVVASKTWLRDHPFVKDLPPTPAF